MTAVIQASVIDGLSWWCWSFLKCLIQYDNLRSCRYKESFIRVLVASLGLKFHCTTLTVSRLLHLALSFTAPHSLYHVCFTWSQVSLHHTHCITSASLGLKFHCTTLTVSRVLHLVSSFTAPHSLYHVCFIWPQVSLHHTHCITSASQFPHRHRPVGQEAGGRGASHNASL